MDSGASAGSFASTATLNVAARASAIRTCFIVCAPVSCIMAPNDGEQKEILTRIAMPTKHYFRCLILTGAARGLFLFVTSFPASAQWVNYPAAGARTADGKPNLAGPAPKTADGRPDFS